MDDLAVPQHHRSGAHRARRHPLLVALLTLGAVAVASAALLWLLLSTDVLGVGDELLEAGGISPSAEAGTPTPAGSVTPAPDQQPTAPVEAPPPSPEPSPEPVPQPEADRSLPLDVLNSTATPGLAARAAEALTGLGWQVGEVDNYQGDEIPTTVLYPAGPEGAEDADDPAAAVAARTAQEVAAELGVGTATASPDVQTLTVVLGPDYQP